MIRFLLLLLLPLAGLCQVNRINPENWKAIAMVNDVLYKNGDRHQDPSVSYVGTGFLLRMGHDTFAVTVKHALYAARNNKTDKVIVNQDLQTWKMYPKNNPNDSVIIGSLINEDSTEKLFSPDNGVLQRDWLLFTTKWISPNITPVTLSDSKPGVGDTIHMFSNPYSFPSTIAVSGKVIRKSGEHLFIKLNGMKKEVLGGASGSPILNTEGHLVGIFSNSKRDRKSGEPIYLVNNTDYLKRILNHQKPLNVDKQSLAALLDSLVQQMPVKRALSLYTKVIEDSTSAEVYEHYYINWSLLQKIAGDFLKENRTQDAILYTKYFTSRHPEIVGFHILLAKAHKQNNDNKKAIKVLQHALNEVYEEDKAEVLKLTDGLK